MPVALLLVGSNGRAPVCSVVGLLALGEAMDTSSEGLSLRVVSLLTLAVGSAPVCLNVQKQINEQCCEVSGCPLGAVQSGMHTG